MLFLSFITENNIIHIKNDNAGKIEPIIKLRVIAEKVMKKM